MSATIGVGSSTFLAGGVPLVAGLFGAAGASLFSYNVHILTKEVKDFQLLQIPIVSDSKISEEQRSLMKLIDEQIDEAVDKLTTIVTEPSILVNLYSIEESQHIDNIPSGTPFTQGSITDSQFAEFMNDFEIMESSDVCIENTNIINQQNISEETEARNALNSLEDEIQSIQIQLNETSRIERESPNFILKDPDCEPRRC